MIPHSWWVISKSACEVSRVDFRQMRFDPRLHTNSVLEKYRLAPHDWKMLMFFMKPLIKLRGTRRVLCERFVFCGIKSKFADELARKKLVA